MFLKVYFFVFIFLLLSTGIKAQHSLPDTALAVKTDCIIKLDGILDESCWYAAPKISNFTQREPQNGSPATERTELALIYSETNLFIGVWCYDKSPEKIIAKSWKRDFEYWTDDNFEVIFDTYLDKRNGYIFVINPNGARADVHSTDEARGFNISWNGIWDAATTITKDGWFAEIRIPFSTLKYPDAAKQIWGVNFERNIRWKREQIFWQGWSIDRDFEYVSGAGTLMGLENIKGTETLEIKPFAAGGFEYDTSFHSKYKFGGDLNYNLTPTMKLNLTANTDFAQVESDRAQINLTRFSIYYPEKRDFFLEGAGNFAMDYYEGEYLFYSRRIGIENGREIPILAGAKLTGKLGSTGINALSIQTAKKNDIATANYSVIRLKQDLFDKSNAGVIFTAKNQGDHYNYLYGFDFNYFTSKLFGDKNLIFISSLSQSFTVGSHDKRNLSYKLGFALPNDNYKIQAVVFANQRDFNPEIGYLERDNNRLQFYEILLTPRVSFIPGIRKLYFSPMRFSTFYKDDDSEFMTGNFQITPIGFQFSTFDYLVFKFERNFENVLADFDIFSDITVKQGKYWFNNYIISFQGYEGREITGQTYLQFGDFFEGSRTLYNIELSWHALSRITFSGDYTYNNIALNEGEFFTHEIGGRIEYGFSPKAISSAFCQWNNQTEEILFNLRFHWIPVVGSDLYIAFNQSFSTKESNFKPSVTTLLAKFIWRFGV